MKTSILSAACGLAVLAVLNVSTAEAGHPVTRRARIAAQYRTQTNPAPTRAGRLGGGKFAWAQLGDIKGEHPLGNRASRAAMAARLRGAKFGQAQLGDIKGEHPLAWEGVDGEQPLGNAAARAAMIGRLRGGKFAWAQLGDIKGERPVPMLGGHQPID